MLQTFSVVHEKNGGKVTSAHRQHGSAKIVVVDPAVSWDKPRLVTEQGQVGVMSHAAGALVKQCNRLTTLADGVRIAKSSSPEDWG
eukprot:12255535-Alexandrium_andersonii.AAC.1